MACARSHQLTPTSEEDCAFFCGYEFINENEMSESVEKIQEAFVSGMWKNPGSLPPCGCPLINGRKCFCSLCPNVRASLACGQDCGSQCQNNPRAPPAIGSKTCLMTDGQGFVICACHTISEFDFIGQFTGQVRPKREIEQCTGFCIEIQALGLVVDASIKGSACRYIKPVDGEGNCIQKLVADKDSLKIVIHALRNIAPGEVLTVSRGAKQVEYLDPNNGQQFCSTVSKFTSQPTQGLDLSFDYIAATSKEVINLLGTPPLLLNRPLQYIENHIFSPLSPVFIPVQYGIHVGISGGIVVQCYMNPNGVCIYVVRLSKPGAMDVHVPSQLAFHFFEDASFAMRRLVSREELTQIFYLVTPGLNQYYARQVTPNFCSTIDARLKQIPKTRLQRISLNSPVILGMPAYRLVTGEERCETNSGEDSQGGCLGTPLEMNMDEIDDEDDSSSEDEKVQEEETLKPRSFSPQHAFTVRTSMSRQLVVTPFDPNYMPNWRQSLTTVLEKAYEGNEIQKLIHRAVEGIAFFAMSRDSAWKFQNYIDLIRTIRREVDWLYSGAPKHERRFVTFHHYMKALSLENSSCNVCSLCVKKKKGIPIPSKTAAEMRKHYESYHSFGTLKFTCPSCGAMFDKPSLFRRHLFECSPYEAMDMRVDVDAGILDGMHDFMASIPSNMKQCSAQGATCVSSNTRLCRGGH